MPKIARFTHNIFALSGGAAPLGVSQFGSLAAASPIFSLDPAVIEALAAWVDGWKDAVTGNNSPALEDLNAVNYVHSLLAAYLLQQGIPEWDPGTTYYTNSFSVRGGILYVSLQDANLNQDPATQDTFWGIPDFTNQTQGQLVGSIGGSWTSETYTDLFASGKGCYGAGLFVHPARKSGAWETKIATSPDGINWTYRTSPPANANRWAVCYGAGKFVAVGDFYSSPGYSGLAMYSTDGINWTQATCPHGSWESVCYGNGQFVAVGAPGYGGAGEKYIMTSPDGINWTPQTPASNQVFVTVAYGAGVFVAGVGTSSNVASYSADGINWTDVTLPVTNFWRSVCFSPDLTLFVMVAHAGASNRVVVSSDGISWTDHAAAANLDWQDVTWGAGIFVCVGASGTGNRVMTSINGTSWTSQTSASDKLWVTVSFGNNRFVATDQYNTLSGSESNNAMICLGSGTATYSMPFRGPSYKKFIVVLDAFTSAGGSDINFPVPFNATPCVYGDSAAVAVATVTNSKITLTSGPTVSGVVFVEGY